MTRKNHLLLCLLVAVCSSAAARADTLRTLGVPDGVYDGGGALIPVTPPIVLPIPLLSVIPPLAIPATFTSHREIQQGAVYAVSTADIFGLKKEVSARLRFEPSKAGDASQFDVLDLDQNSENVGSASCTSSSCSFEATVMNGTFFLRETWIPTENGFRISNGFQIFDGLPAYYSGTESSL